MVAVVMIGLPLLAMLNPNWRTPSAALSSGYLLSNLAISAAGAVAGGIVTTLLSPASPHWHAMGLAAFGFAMSVASALQYGSRQPRWYQVVLSALTPLGVVVGYALAARF